MPGMRRRAHAGTHQAAGRPAVDGVGVGIGPPGAVMIDAIISTLNRSLSSRKIPFHIPPHLHWRAGLHQRFMRRVTRMMGADLPAFLVTKIDQRGTLPSPADDVLYVVVLSRLCRRFRLERDQRDTVDVFEDAPNIVPLVEPGRIGRAIEVAAISGNGSGAVAAADAGIRISGLLIYSSCLD